MDKGYLYFTSNIVRTVTRINAATISKGKIQRGAIRHTVQGYQLLKSSMSKGFDLKLMFKPEANLYIMPASMKKKKKKKIRYIQWRQHK